MVKNTSSHTVSANSRVRFAVAIIAVVMGTSRTGFAQDVAACIKASDTGQDLRDQSKLLEARDAFAVCAKDACPQQIRVACAEWLTALGTRVPTLVVAVKDHAGHDVTTGVLKIDGKPIDGAMLGSAFPVNPGAHKIRVEHPGDDAVEQDVVAREGDQRRIIQILVGKPQPRPSGGGGGGSSKESGGGGPPLGTWIAAGVGAAALVPAIGFGVSGLGNYSDFKACKAPDCSANKANDLRSDAKSQLLLSDIFTVVSVVGFGTAAILWILAPSKSDAKESNLTWTLGPTGGAASIKF
jgi:hypothetical protein